MNKNDDNPFGPVDLSKEQPDEINAGEIVQRMMKDLNVDYHNPADLKQIAALSRDIDEQAGKIMKMENTIRKLCEVFITCDWNGNTVFTYDQCRDVYIEAHDFVLGGIGDESNTHGDNVKGE